METAVLSERDRGPVILWLATVCALIILMVSVGGITRLTGSGLSIVDWAPLMGAVPPLSESAWQEAFHRYQQFPQYRLLNHGMSLADFQFIFFWEYLHRLLGRLIGVAFLFPWIYFVARGRVRQPLAGKLFVGFLLGGLQGALGWFMVKSGLVDRPEVSHFRLAAHLTLALVVLCYLFWMILEVSGRKPVRSDAALRKIFPWILALVALQIVYGAFVAGLKAGFGYNTYPKMMESWIAPEAFRLTPAWLNLVENPAMVQFIHRWVGATVLVSSVALLNGAARRAGPSRAIAVFSGLVALQFLLGVSTLVLAVPLPLAALHQLGACFVLLAGIAVLHGLQGTKAA